MPTWFVDVSVADSALLVDFLVAKAKEWGLHPQVIKHFPDATCKRLADALAETLGIQSEAGESLLAFEADVPLDRSVSCFDDFEWINGFVMLTKKGFRMALRGYRKSGAQVSPTACAIVHFQDSVFSVEKVELDRFARASRPPQLLKAKTLPPEDSPQTPKELVPRQDVACEVCRVSAPSFFCTCSGVKAFLCSTCVIAHMQQAPGLVHPLLSTDIQVADATQYRLRCERFVEGKAELRQNLATLDQCCSELTAAVDGAVTRLLQLRDVALKKLQQWKAELAADIEASVREAQQSLKDDGARLAEKYSEFLRDFQTGNLVLFKYKIDTSFFDSGLQQLLTTEFVKPKPAFCEQCKKAIRGRHDPQLCRDNVIEAEIAAMEGESRIPVAQCPGCRTPYQLSGAPSCVRCEKADCVDWCFRCSCLYAPILAHSSAWHRPQCPLYTPPPAVPTQAHLQKPNCPECRRLGRRCDPPKNLRVPGRFSWGES